jgi:hypothetical protein
LAGDTAGGPTVAFLVVGDGRFSVNTVSESEVAHESSALATDAAAAATLADAALAGDWRRVVSLVSGTSRAGDSTFGDPRSSSVITVSESDVSHESSDLAAEVTGCRGERGDVANDDGPRSGVSGNSLALVVSFAGAVDDVRAPLGGLAVAGCTASVWTVSESDVAADADSESSSVASIRFTVEAAVDLLVSFVLRVALDASFGNDSSIAPDAFDAAAVRCLGERGCSSAESFATRFDGRALALTFTFFDEAASTISSADSAVAELLESLSTAAGRFAFGDATGFVFAAAPSFFVAVFDSGE